MNTPLWLSNLTAYSVQVALVIFACALAATLLRVRDPGVMLRYWRTLLLVSLFLPVLQPWRQPAAAGAVEARGFGDIGVRSTGSVATAWADVVAFVLMAGVAGRLLSLALGLWRLQGYRRRARPIELPAADAIASQLGFRAPLCLTSELRVPVTFGARQPTILLPARVLQLEPEQQAAIVCHEMLHVRRRDWQATLAEECIRSLLWFHPAIAWLLGRIRLSREQLVDREVVAITGRRQAYLEALLEVASAGVGRRPVHAAPLFLWECHLKDRIDLLLEEVLMSTRRILARVGLCTAVMSISGTLAVRAFPLQGPADEPEIAKRAAGGGKGGVRGGISAGVAGGVPGGVASGVPGGIEGGIDRGIDGDAQAGTGDDGKKAPADAAKELEAGKRAAPRKVVYKVNPDFPYAEGKRVRGAADVVMLLTIEKSGEVSDVKVLKGHRAFNPSAVDAVKQWKFEPSEQSPAVATVTIRFVPPPPPPPPPLPVKK